MLSTNPFGQHAMVPYGYLGRGYGAPGLMFGADAGISSPTSDPVEGGAAPPEQGKLLGLIGGLLGGSLEREREVLVARIQNYSQLKDKLPYSIVPGKAWYEGQINIMKARVAAIDREDAVTGTWRSLGQTGVAVGIAAGVALTALIAIGAARAAGVGKSTRRRKNGRKRRNSRSHIRRSNPCGCK